MTQRSLAQEGSRSPVAKKHSFEARHADSGAKRAAFLWLTASSLRLRHPRNGRLRGSKWVQGGRCWERVEGVRGFLGV